jgi:antitoxin (DNA-binding transcriptional repressor) of toxin-antitoxin stability system
MATRVLYTLCMVMKSIAQAKAEFSALIDAVSKGEQVIITKAGRPVAKLVPFGGPPLPRRPGALKGKIKIAADFDSPLEYDCFPS